jgi:hypothetical protein
MEWFDRDLDDFLFERQRGKEGDIEYKDIHEEYFRKMLTLHERTFVILEKISDDFIKWRFNAF